MSATSRAGRAMAGGLRRRRVLGVSPGTLAARHAQAIERALDLGDQPPRHAGVAGRRLQLLVSEQCLNHANVRPRSSRWVAKLWRSACRESVLRSPAAFAACL